MTTQSRRGQHHPSQKEDADIQFGYDSQKHPTSPHPAVLDALFHFQPPLKLREIVPPIE
jgi:hypothetical protein